ncbi:hypothetical protein [Actinophytocola gossypii]|uniref:Integral membrane protein n=1 Tax=Actinophytocola gossypii TaxID=2812003 RepID=A0ABT2JEJ5_9PSEU|nr:hypothetical protein [Actinophytocola gossypii]MCT2586280.1 hypothetical protein [Actinophytocola gossypii]
MRIASDAPRTVRAAGVLVGLQGLAGLVFAAALLIRALDGASTEGNNVFGEAGYFVVLGGGVVAVGVALVLGKHWARSPAVVVELLLLGVAWYAAGPSGRPEYGVPIGLLCALVLYLLFAGPSRMWSLGLDEDESGKSGQ